MITRLCVFAIVLIGSSAASAQAPADQLTAPQLLPVETFAYARVSDVAELREKFGETSMGQMLSDPQISPFFQDLYGSMLEQAEGVKEEVGMSVDELLRIPQGEVAVGFVPTKEMPTLVLIIDAGERIKDVQFLIDRAMKERSEGGAAAREKIDRLELVNLEPGNQPGQQPCYLIADDKFVMTFDFELLRMLAKVYLRQVEGYKSLADRSEFTDILSRCVGDAGEPPQVSFYADPIRMARDLSKNNVGAVAVFAMLPALGIDGIKGIGGSVILAPENFDSIFHMHLLLDSPRRGVLSVIRPKEGPIDPETWVPEDIATYMTANWRIGSTVTAVGEVYDTFMGEGAFKREILEPASKELKLDVRRDLIDQLDDRISLVQLVLRPAEFNSDKTIVAVKLKDAEKFERDVLPKLLAFAREKDKRWKETSEGDTKIYYLEVPRSDDAMGAPQPAAAILDGRLLVSDSLRALRQTCRTYADAEGLLVQSLEYKVIKQRIEGQLGGMKIFGLEMNRPEESLRQFYDMALDPKNRKMLEEESEGNPIFTALHGALERNELPPFEVIQKHLAPGGGFFAEDESGLHYTSFSLRR